MTDFYYKVGEIDERVTTLEDQTLDARTTALEAKAIFNQVNVKDYGAVGDGVTDNSTILQSIIDDETIYYVYFPEGTYDINTTLDLSSRVNPLWFNGVVGSTIIQYNGTDHAINYVGSGLSRIKFSGLRVLGNDLAKDGLHAEGLTPRLIIEDCEFSDHGGVGLYLKNCYAPSIKNTNCSRNGGNSSQTYKGGVYFYGSHNISATALRCTSNNQDGMYLNLSMGCSFTGCQFEDNARRGVYLYQSEGNSFVGNYIEHNGLTTNNSDERCGFFINGTSDRPSRGNLINGNYFNGGTATADDRSSRYGIYLDYAEGTIIQANMLFNHGVASLYAGTNADRTVWGINTTREAGSNPDATIISKGSTNEVITIEKRTRAGTPVANYTPRFIGEECFDSSNTVWYKSTGLTNTDWVALN